MAKLPIGIQDFPQMRKEDFLYVDKTELIYRMMTTGVAYFLARPRRFGKSLLVSTLESFFKGEFDNYWFTTATPTFAINLIKKNNYLIPELEKGIIVGKEIETSHESNIIDLPTLLFQTGYLTIDSYNEDSWTYFLKFPNEEVRRSFLDHLLYEFAELRPSEIFSGNDPN